MPRKSTGKDWDCFVGKYTLLAMTDASILWYNPAASERKHILPGTGIKRP